MWNTPQFNSIPNFKLKKKNAPHCRSATSHLTKPTRARTTAVQFSIGANDCKIIILYAVPLHRYISLSLAARPPLYRLLITTYYVRYAPTTHTREPFLLTTRLTCGNIQPHTIWYKITRNQTTNGVFKFFPFFLSTTISVYLWWVCADPIHNLLKDRDEHISRMGLVRYKTAGKSYTRRLGKRLRVSLECSGFTDTTEEEENVSGRQRQRRNICITPHQFAVWR